MRLSKEDYDTIRNADAVSDTSSYLYGEFQQPGVMTNDLANNKEHLDRHLVAD